jgi:lipopolysaccharide assembly protein A
MRFVTWTVRLLVFLFLLAFAAKNTDPVTLHFYFELAWQAPLIVLLLVFFAAGTAFGLVAALATLFGQRREILRLRREPGGQPDPKSGTGVPLPPPGANA